MSSVLFLTLTLLHLVLTSDTKDNVKSQDERQLAQMFLQNISKVNVRHRTVPTYLKKLYKIQSRRSTYSQVSCIFSEDQKPSEKRQMIFTFDLSDIKNLREASQLQLRLFKRRSKQRTFYYVHLYQILENNINNASCGNKRLISSQFIRQKSRGEWLVFDVTSLFNSQENVPTTMIQSFLIEVKAVKDDTKSTRVSIVKSGRKQPFILIFFRNPRQPLSHSEVETPVELSIDKFPFGKTRFPRTATSLDRQNELCSRRKNLRINFHQLGMTNILVPKDYDAYYCAGTCPVYSGEKIYSFLRNRQQLENGKVFTGCCVPTEYGTLDVLYLHEKGVTYARFQGMVVLSCGCR